MKPPNPTPRRKTFIYSGISLKVSRCLLLCLPDEVAHNNGGGELGQAPLSFLLWRLSRGGTVGKFAQLDEFCTNRLASFLPNICVITLTMFLSLLGGIMTHDARKDWRDLCREAVAESDPAKLIAIVNELNRELDEEKKKKAAVFLQKIDKKRA